MVQGNGLRLFFALVPDRDTRGRIETLHRHLSGVHGFKGRAVKAERYHVTLAFLGNQPPDRVPDLLTIGAGLEMPACTVACDFIGRFPRAGVVWFGSRNPPEALRTFQASLCAALERARIRFDRKPWHFHVTLYRDLRTPPASMDPEPVNWRLNGFSLMESVNTKNGLEYRQLGHWKAIAPADD